MEKNHPISELMSTTMQKIREMVDVNTIVGTPIHTDDGVTLIPVSRLSFGFASGGSDFTTKNQKPDAENSFGGGFFLSPATIRGKAQKGHQHHAAYFCGL